MSDGKLRSCARSYRKHALLSLWRWPNVTPQTRSVRPRWALCASWSTGSARLAPMLFTLAFRSAMLALHFGRAAAMARAPAYLPAGIRLTDHISLGVIAKTFPLNQVQQILADTGKASERDLPTHVM